MKRISSRMFLHDDRTITFDGIHLCTRLIGYGPEQVERYAEALEIGHKAGWRDMQHKRLVSWCSQYAFKETDEAPPPLKEKLKLYACLIL